MTSRIREWVAGSFHRFGVHCATHQMRVLLICSVVIVSLFYPALALYSSSISSRLFDPFSPRDLRDFWDGYNSLQTRQDSAARALCGQGRTIRVERVLMRNSRTSNTFGVLNARTLYHAVQFVHKIRPAIAAACVKDDLGSCLILSPLMYWHEQEDLILSDEDIPGTVQNSANTSSYGIMLDPRLVLARREYEDHPISRLVYAGYLAFTFLFKDADCNEQTEHNAWINKLEQASVQWIEQFDPPKQEPTLLALEWGPRKVAFDQFSSLSLALYLAYIIFVVVYSRYMTSLNFVYSRIGLAFTGAVEMLMSTITSLSVCALWGFRVTMVPWNIVAIVILFVGTENMFILVDAVCTTAVTLPVKERIGLGLRKAGTSNTMKLVSYNTILGVMAVFSNALIRQFCVFSIVVLVAHWFLIHTLFTAVLAIDLRRLELSDTLTQDDRLNAPKLAVPLRSPRSTPLAKTLAVSNSLLTGRAKRNVSLFMLISVSAVLYYITSTVPPAKSYFNLQHRPPAWESEARSGILSPALSLWQALNPRNDPMLHLRVEEPVIMTLTSEVDSRWLTDGPQPRSFSQLRRIFWITQFVMMPIVITTFLLYLLLLVLIKEPSIVEAQPSMDSDELDAIELEPLDSAISFTALSRPFASDINLIATSRNGDVILVSSTTDELALWRDADKQFEYLHPASIKPGRRISITAIAVNSSSTLAAYGTASGSIAWWPLSKQAVLQMAPVVPETANFAVVDLVFGSERELFAVFEHGLVIRHILDQSPPPRKVLTAKPNSTVRSQVFRLGKPVVAFMTESGLIHLCVGDQEVKMQAGNPDDDVLRADACELEIDNVQRIVMATATRAGVVSLWDGISGECLHIFEDFYGEINKIRISYAPSRPCGHCGEMPEDSFSVAFSAAQNVFLYWATISTRVRHCTCPTSRPISYSTTVSSANRSRSGSIASTAGTSSPVRTRPRVQHSSSKSGALTPEFPVSGHGRMRRSSSTADGQLHTRKQSLETLLRIPAEDGAIQESGPSTPIEPKDVLSVKAISQDSESTSIWRTLRLQKIAEISCERGVWDSRTSALVGIRRRPRIHKDRSRTTKEKNPPHRIVEPFSMSILDRWEVWSFSTMRSDISQVKASTLSSLLQVAPDSETKNHHPRLPFTRVSRFVMQDSQCLAGLGNSIGVFRFKGSARASA